MSVGSEMEGEYEIPVDFLIPVGYSREFVLSTQFEWMLIKVKLPDRILYRWKRHLIPLVEDGLVPRYDRNAVLDWIAECVMEIRFDCGVEL